jgi:hypothetical protein
VAVVVAVVMVAVAVLVVIAQHLGYLLRLQPITQLQ